MNRQIISPRTFALGGFLVIALLTYASCSYGAECENHCSEERIEALEAQNVARHARPVVAAKVAPTIEATARALGEAIRSVGFVCDKATLVSRIDDMPGPVPHLTRFRVSCPAYGPYAASVTFTVDVTTRIIVYPGAL